jgi:single-stranded-DNA-specific exonuclease
LPALRLRSRPEAFREDPRRPEGPGKRFTRERAEGLGRHPIVCLRLTAGMSWIIAPCSYDEAAALAVELGIGETTARVLARRGLGDPAAARRFLEGAPPRHDPLLLGDMAAARETIQRAVADGKRICVHGDYDADGICATALAVLILRELGADVVSHLPSRFEEGYGVQSETLERLGSEGCGLVLTVDCGVTAVQEIADARGRGLDVVVTDHHRPGDQLPDCPLVVTRPSNYPFPELCGTGVVYKLGQALLGEDSPALAAHLDLVALATIADVVPLTDENRALALAGLRALAWTRKPGLKALMRASRVDAASLDESAVGFRLAPRINAAGRLCRPEAALDLLLAEDDETAIPLAGKLEELNRERQAVEDRILREAVSRIAEWSEAEQRRRAYVLADEEWHQGVIGIVASRLVERFHRPVVLIAGGEREWKGSGRSISAFDLHAGLAACSEHLTRFGGHRAAAGLSIDPDRVEPFAEAFAAHAAGTLGEDELRPHTVIDAVLPPGTQPTDALCAELKQLAPFGLGNPRVTLLAPACELMELATVGEGKHLRFRIRQEDGALGGQAIAFRLGAQVDRFRRTGRYDVVFSLEENHWNGTVAPQLVVREILDSAESYPQLRNWLREEFGKSESERDASATAIFGELGLTEGASRRSLFESEAFRSLLEEEPLARAA